MTPFDRAFEFVIGVEGGLVDDPDDPGGLTRYGISKRAYPDEDIERMTLARAKELYRRDYWSKVRGDELPEGVALCLFDFAVNSGVVQAVKCLQIALDVAADGLIGNQTLTALQRFDPALLIERLQAERIVHLASLPTFRRFGRGWSRRVIKAAMQVA